MWKKLIALLRGDVRVHAKSAFPERILNICTARGIVFREPRFLGEQTLAFSIDRRDSRRRTSRASRASRFSSDGCGGATRCWRDWRPVWRW